MRENPHYFDLNLSVTRAGDKNVTFRSQFYRRRWQTAVKSIQCSLTSGGKRCTVVRAPLTRVLCLNNIVLYIIWTVECC